MLRDMGFSENAVQRALQREAGDVERALEWLSEVRPELRTFFLATDTRHHVKHILEFLIALWSNSSPSFFYSSIKCKLLTRLFSSCLVAALQ